MLRRLKALCAPHGAPDDDTSAEIAQLLATLEGAVSRADLPDGAARDALAEAIRCGEVDGLYTPIGHAQHNITLAGLVADVDPRLTVAEWRAWWDAGRSPYDELLARERAAQARGDAMLREIKARQQTEQGGQD